MDWLHSMAVAGRLLLLMPLVATLTHAWTLPVSVPATTPIVAPVAARQLNEISPYVDLALCPIRGEPWSCAKQKSARILDVWDQELNVQWQKLKVEADRQLNATIERRGYSASELPIKEKPSTLLKKIEIGTKYMKEYLAETMDGFLGREYEPLESTKADDDSENAEDDEEAEEEAETAAEETAEETDSDDDDEQETSDADEEEEEDDAPEEDEPEHENENESDQHSAVNNQQLANDDVKSSVFSTDTASDAVEFIELEDGEEEAAAGDLRKPSKGGGKRKKNKTKRKKKGQQQQHQPATLVVVQAAQDHHDLETAGHGAASHAGGHGGGHTGGKPFKHKNKRTKRKKKKGQHGATTQVQHDTGDSLDLGLLDDLVDTDVLHSGYKRKKPTNYGRSNGVTRGKKKKKKKALAKLVFVGTLIKAKVELLLKILGAHLQVKFFAIALIGLLINIARFWIDVKRGGTPAKVVYVEHAHHQHHYEDHGDDWNEQGSYWKRSLQTDPSIEEADSSTDSYQVHPQQHPQQDSHYMAYRNQYQWQ